MIAFRWSQVALIAAALVATVALRVVVGPSFFQGLLYLLIVGVAAAQYGPVAAVAATVLGVLAAHVQLAILAPGLLRDPSPLWTRAYFAGFGFYFLFAAAAVIASARHYRTLGQLDRSNLQRRELDAQHRRELEASLARETAARHEAEAATRVKHDLLAKLSNELRDTRRLAAIVESTDDAIVAKDLTGIVTSWNRAAERVFGYTAEEIIGRSIRVIIPADRQDEEDRVLATVGGAGSTMRFETVRQTKSGALIPISLTVSPIRDEEGQIIGLSKIARDISERRRNEAAVAEAYAEARQANRVKDEFLATLSHELRTPLNAILGYARLLRTGALDGDRTARGLEILERNAAALSQIVEDVLDISRITAGKVRLHVQPVDLASVVEQAEASVRPAADAKGVRIQVLVDGHTPAISGDPDRLQQVVWNLLTNAVKFTPRDGRVQVRLSRVNSHVELVVSDTGRGIDPAFLPHVFERFRQADGQFSREHGGLGLGLAICRDLVQLHGGTIEAASDGPGSGASFAVKLPTAIVHAFPNADIAREHPAAPTSRSNIVAGRLDGIRVLAVDDDGDALTLLREILESAGAIVTTVNSAPRALQQLDAEPPDVLIADIGMPGMDGFALIRSVRESDNAALRGIPATALTAYARSEDRMRALQAGFQTHLVKPVDPTELIVAVKAAVRGTRA